MATASNNEFEGLKGAKETQILQDGAEGNQTKPNEIIFTPEQRRILGEAYRIILSWGQDRKIQPVSTMSDADSISVASRRRIAVETEA